MRHEDMATLMEIELDLHNGRNKLRKLSDYSEVEDIKECDKLLVEALDIVANMRQQIFHKYGFFV